MAALILLAIGCLRDLAAPRTARQERTERRWLGAHECVRELPPRLPANLPALPPDNALGQRSRV